jgi:hypothetical protein
MIGIANASADRLVETASAARGEPRADDPEIEDVLDLGKALG